MWGSHRCHSEPRFLLITQAYNPEFPPPSPLDPLPLVSTPECACSLLFSMAVATLGEAWKLGWRVRARCYWLGPNKSGKRSSIWCDTTVELDMKTLIWTRGENFPLELLSQRLRCPKCDR